MNEVKSTPAYIAKTTSPTGSVTPGAIERLENDALIHDGNTQVLDFADIDYGNNQTEECIVIPLLDGNFTDIGDAIVTKIHGTVPYPILVASEASYLARSTASPNADTDIPAHFFIPDSERIKVAHETTDNAFEFLYILPDASGLSAVFDPSIQEGTSGYPLIEVAIPYLERDSYSIDVPGGNASESVFGASGTDIFVVVENPTTGERELQLFGCTANPAPIDIHPEMQDIMKGAQNGVWRRTVASRPMTITGNAHSSNGWIWIYLYGAAHTGYDGMYETYEVSTDFQQWKIVEIIFSGVTLDGRLVRIWAPSATIRSTGAFDPGSPEVMHPFEIQMGQVAYIKQTRNLYAIYRFAINQTIVAP